MRNILFITALFFSLVACQDDTDINGDPAEIALSENTFLIFGHFYGECLGEGCVETFKLTNQNLYEDTIDDYSASMFDFVTLDNSLFERVKDLYEFIPEELLESPDNTFGCPDCTDGGGIHIEFTQNNKTTKWRIDQDKSNVPTYLHAFIDKVNEKIVLLNQ